MIPEENTFIFATMTKGPSERCRGHFLEQWFPASGGGKVFSSMCVSVSLCPNFSLLIGHQSNLVSTLIQYEFILIWLYLQRPYFQRRSHSRVPGRYGLGEMLWNPVQVSTTTPILSLPSPGGGLISHSLFCPLTAIQPKLDPNAQATRTQEWFGYSRLGAHAS